MDEVDAGKRGLAMGTQARVQERSAGKSLGVSGILRGVDVDVVALRERTAAPHLEPRVQLGFARSRVKRRRHP